MACSPCDAEAGRAPVGLNHSRALGNAAKPNRSAAKPELHGNLLGLRVACQDGLGGFGRSGLGGLELCRDSCNALTEVRHRQMDTDPAGRADEHVGVGKFKCLAGEGGHFEGIGQALWSGAGVGVAGVDDDSLGGVVL